MYKLGQYTLFFSFYSFIGGLIETLYRFVTEGYLYGVHGFLHLPILPIYGFGALIIIWLSRRIHNPVLLFLASALAATVLEFATSWLIQMIFGITIWDYNNDPFNLYGRVDLFSSLGFGVAALVLVYLIHPFLSAILKHASRRTTIVVAGFVWVVLLTDAITSFVQRLVH
jgi:uncharacterized membrane protein